MPLSTVKLHYRNLSLLPADPPCIPGDRACNPSAFPTMIPPSFEGLRSCGAGYNQAGMTFMLARSTVSSLADLLDRIFPGVFLSIFQVRSALCFQPQHRNCIIQNYAILVTHEAGRMRTVNAYNLIVRNTGSSAHNSSALFSLPTSSFLATKLQLMKTICHSFAIFMAWKVCRIGILGLHSAYVP